MASPSVSIVASSADTDLHPKPIALSGRDPSWADSRWASLFAPSSSASSSSGSEAARTLHYECAPTPPAPIGFDQDDSTITTTAAAHAGEAEEEEDAEEEGFPYTRWGIDLDHDNHLDDIDGASAELENEDLSSANDRSEEGMTPTPNSKLCDEVDCCGFMLDDDLENLPVFDMLLIDDEAQTTDLSFGTDPSAPQAPMTFETPIDAAEYMSTARTDIDMELQRCLRQYEANETLQTNMATLQKEATLGEATRAMATKSLIHEAANRALRSLTAANNGVDGPLREEVIDAWRNIERRAMADLHRDGYQTAQRNLSCMCIFAPKQGRDCSTPLPPSYGENDSERVRRAVVQTQTLKALATQQAVGSNSLFLKSPEVSLSHSTFRPDLAKEKNEEDAIATIAAYDF